jgi:hypothetical protein
MRRATLMFCLTIAWTAPATVSGQSSSVNSVPRGTRSFYGTNFGNRYQYLGLGYGYGPGAFGPGAWSGFGGGGYGGYGGYGGRSRGYGGYGGSGRYGGIQTDLQIEALHQQQMMWSLNFAPMPQTAPTMTVNPFWNPYQSRLGDDIYHRQEPPQEPEVFENPYAHHPDQHSQE